MLEKKIEAQEDTLVFVQEYKRIYINTDEKEILHKTS